MSAMDVNGSDTSTLRLFHLDLPPEAVERFTTMAGTGEWPLKYALGATKLRPGFVDVVDLRDLGDMTLSRFLTEAHAVPASEIKPFKAQIDGLKGHVVILPASAFDGMTQTLNVATPLRWIASFTEEKPRGRGAPIQSDAARRQGSAAATDLPPSPQARLRRIALLGAVLLALLALALMLR